MAAERGGDSPMGVGRVVIGASVATQSIATVFAGFSLRVEQQPPAVAASGHRPV